MVDNTSAEVRVENVVAPFFDGCSNFASLACFVEPQIIICSEQGDVAGFEILPRPSEPVDALELMIFTSGIRPADIIVFTYIYSPSAECFIRQRVMSVTHPPKLDRKSAGSRI